MSILPLVQYFIQNHQDEQKETTRKKEQDRRDSLLREDYEASVSRMKQEYSTSVATQQDGYQASVAEQRTEYAASVKHIRRDFGDSNNRTLTVIGQTLAKYKLQLDTAEKLIRDSAKIVVPEQPVLDVVTMPDGAGIMFLKSENGLNHYRITFESEDGASCCYELKMSAVILLPTSDPHPDLGQGIYQGPVRMALTQTDNMAKGLHQRWTFTINDHPAYDMLYIWVRGTYKDRLGNHTYNIDKVYYNRKSANTFGQMGAEFQKSVKDIVHRYEKE
jgi:hypothetical protein